MFLKEKAEMVAMEIKIIKYLLDNFFFIHPYRDIYIFDIYRKLLNIIKLHGWFWKTILLLNLFFFLISHILLTSQVLCIFLWYLCREIHIHEYINAKSNIFWTFTLTLVEDVHDHVNYPQTYWFLAQYNTFFLVKRTIKYRVN